MTGRKRWMAAVIAETKKPAPAMPYARQTRVAKAEPRRIVVKKSAA
ncbi:MAG: hypothetical protein AAGH17_04075 [Pseudomonadota bacterium]